MPSHVQYGILRSRNSTRVAALLVQDSRVDVNDVNKFDVSALMWAARNDNVEITRMLLDHPEIDALLIDDKGRTALDHALSKEGSKTASLIREHIERKWDLERK